MNELKATYSNKARGRTENVVIGNVLKKYLNNTKNSKENITFLSQLSWVLNVLVTVETKSLFELCCKLYCLITLKISLNIKK